MASSEQPPLFRGWGEAALRDILNNDFAARLGIDRSLIDPDKNFSEYGLDSVDAVIATDSIGKRLGFELPPEFLFENQTLNAIIRALLSDDSSKEQATEIPEIFLFPGAGGRDSPSLARMRVQSEPKLVFEVVRLGDWLDWVGHRLEFDELISRACDFIDKQQSKGPVRLSGYSQGGQLAFATAWTLQRAGRDVRYVGLLDSRAEMMSLTAKARDSFKLNVLKPAMQQLARVFSGSAADFEPRPKFRPHDWLWLLPGGRPLIIFLARIGRPLFPARQNVKLDDFIQMRIFVKLWDSWFIKNAEANMLHAPVFLFRSEEPGSPALGWENYCSNLRIVSVAGNHITMLQPGNVEKLIAQVAHAVSSTGV